MLETEGSSKFLANVFKRDKERSAEISNEIAHKLQVIDSCLELLLLGFSLWGKDDRPFESRHPVAIASSSLFNKLLAIRELMLLGYIAEATTVLARTIETNWLIQYLDENNPRRIQQWQQRGISPKLLREKLPILNESPEKAIWDKLNKYGHPNFESLLLTQELKEALPISIRLGGYPTERSLRVIMVWLADMISLCLLTFAKCFNEYLWSNNEWNEKYQNIFPNCQTL